MTDILLSSLDADGILRLTMNDGARRNPLRLCRIKARLSGECGWVTRLVSKRVGFIQGSRRVYFHTNTKNIDWENSKILITQQARLICKLSRELKSYCKALVPYSFTKLQIQFSILIWKIDLQ